MNCRILNKLKKNSLRALKQGEIAVAAVIVKDDKIIASAYNKRQKQFDVTAHAEVVAIKKAAKKIKDWRLNGYSMYVTLEPCEMCKAIIKESRIDDCFFLIKRLKNTSKKSKNKVNYLQTNQKGEFVKILQESLKKLR